MVDGKKMIRHDGGVVDSPGTYLIGSPFLRRRKSSFIDGARADAEELILELIAYLDRRASSRAADCSRHEHAAMSVRGRLAGSTIPAPRTYFFRPLRP